MKLIQTIDAECCPQVLAAPLDREEADRLADALKVLADPARLQLLSLIGAAPEGEACVCNLVEPMGLSQPTVSHHLKVLTNAGLLGREQRGAGSTTGSCPGRSNCCARRSPARPERHTTEEDGMSELHEQVRDRYAAAAKAVGEGFAANDWDQEAGCCDPEKGLGQELYDITSGASCPTKRSWPASDAATR